MATARFWIDDHLYSEDLAAASPDTIAVGDTVLVTLHANSGFPGMHAAEVKATDLHGIRFRIDRYFGELYVPWKHVESLLIARDEEDAKRITELAEQFHADRRRGGKRGTMAS